jgi:hypothetical protein
MGLTRDAGKVYRGRMASKVIEVADDELALILSALRSYLSDFGHDEADMQRAIKQLIAKLPRPEKTVA